MLDDEEKKEEKFVLVRAGASLYVVDKPWWDKEVADGRYPSLEVLAEGDAKTLEAMADMAEGD